MNIIGIVGPIACGKGVVVDYLKEKYGYTSFSLSSILHDALKRQGITKFTRTTLQDLGDKLRKSEGDGVLAKRAIQQLKDYNLKLETYNLQNKKQTDKKFQKIIIEGIRNPGEVEYLRTIPGFVLIAVDAPQKRRFERVLSRAKPWDPKDWKSFLKIDGRDGGDAKNTSGQQVRKCMALADMQLTNNGSIEVFHEEVNNALLSRHPLHTGR